MVSRLCFAVVGEYGRTAGRLASPRPTVAVYRQLCFLDIAAAVVEA